jgi:hypothetical protein
MDMNKTGNGIGQVGIALSVKIYIQYIYRTLIEALLRIPDISENANLTGSSLS